MAGRFVVDNSVVVAWCFADQANAYTDAVLDSLARRKAVVPAIWPLELGNVLTVAERKGRLDEAGIARFVELVSRLPLEVEAESPARMLGEVLALAREYHLSTYDASYLDQAMRLGLPLATRDAALLKGAKQAGTQIYKP